jgi:hypothetical protein
LGHILAFSTPEELVSKMSAVREFTPKVRLANVEGISFAVEAFLASN